MIDRSIARLNNEQHPIVRSDRGCHYRWSGWIERMNKVGLTRSILKKGCSLDNSACEGLFEQLKIEMCYNQEWLWVGIEEFINSLNAYFVWYNEKRIKVSFGNMSPKEYRQSLEFAA